MYLLGTFWTELRKEKEKTKKKKHKKKNKKQKQKRTNEHKEQLLPNLPHKTINKNRTRKKTSLTLSL